MTAIFSNGEGDTLTLNHLERVTITTRGPEVFQELSGALQFVRRDESPRVECDGLATEQMTLDREQLRVAADLAESYDFRQAAEILRYVAGS